MTDPNPPWRPELPHNHLPALPPAGELESRAVLKACIEARAALAELKQAAELIPNQAMLINTIPLLEAKDSSEIENIVTTTDQLFQYAQSHAQGQDNADPATKEALRYRTALQRGYQSLKDRPLCTATAVDVCRTLKGVDMDIRRTPGTQLINDRTGEVIYTPPEGEAHLRDMLANWERFLHNQTELDPLIRMAVGHYQKDLDALARRSGELALQGVALADSPEWSADEAEMIILEQQDIEARRKSIHEGLKTWGPQAKAHAGVIVTISREGDVEVIRGLVRDADRKALAAAVRPKGATGGDERSGAAGVGLDPGTPSAMPARRTAGCSEALTRRLAAQRTMALQALLAQTRRSRWPAWRMSSCCACSAPSIRVRHRRCRCRHSCRTTRWRRRPTTSRQAGRGKLCSRPSKPGVNSFPISRASGWAG